MSQAASHSELSARLRLARARPLKIASLVVFLVLALVGFLPLFGGPGYEAALAAGVLLPGAAAVTTALVVAGTCSGSVIVTGRTALGFGIACGSWLALIAMAVSLLHGSRVGFCDVWPSLWLMLLGPGAGAVMGGAWGALAGGWTVGVTGHRGPGRRIMACVTALAGPLAGIVLSLWNFYVSPAVFAFDPFFGYFAGPIYDTVIDPIARLSSYRLGSLLTLLGAWVAAGYVHVRSGRLRFRHDGQWGQSLAGVMAIVLSITMSVQAPELSHNTTEASVLKVLEGSASHARCTVRYDPSISRAYVELLARDCQAHLVGLEDYFEIRGPEQVRVLLFASPQQKGRLMGAVHTLVAKPWRQEIYLQVDQHPHPVLRHELAHVVAGSFAEGPFKIAGSFGGWLPDPGRIEGFAEAAAAREYSDFTANEWTRAMLEVNLLPPLERIFELSFFGQNSSTAYTVAGAFVTWLKSHYGASSIRAWYAGAPLEKLTGGKGLAQLEREFRRDLQRIDVGRRLRIAAAARFSAPSIFGRRCPHAVDLRFGQAQQLLGALELEGAEAAFKDVLKLDPDHVGARLGLGHCALRRAQADRALDAYSQVANDARLAIGNRLGAREAMANTHFLAGERQKAARIYGELIEKVASEDHLRNLAVKRRATSAPEAERQVLTALLLGSFKQPPTWDTAAPLLGAWRERETERGLASYLIAKNLFNRSQLAETARYLDEALTRELELVSVQREALRLRVIVGCARRELGTVKRALEDFLRLPATTLQQKLSAQAIAGRCGVSTKIVHELGL